MAPPRGELLAVRPAWRTAAPDGPVSLLASWEAADAEPRALGTNRVELHAALAAYRKRAPLATCFSDQKRRGLRLPQRHLRDPARLTRVLLAAG
jgi:hypothetical protein